MRFPPASPPRASEKKSRVKSPVHPWSTWKSAGLAAGFATRGKKASGHDFQLFGRHLAALAVRNEFEGNFVTLAQLVETRALYGADVNEGILAAVVRRNEAKAFFGIKPLDGSLRHGNPFLETLQMHASAAADHRNRIFC